MTEEIPTTPSDDEAAVPDTHPFAAQIAAIQQLLDETNTHPVRLYLYIAEVLQETDPSAIREIRRLVKAITPPNALKLLIKTLKMEADGGVIVQDTSRRRTMGGVYFYFARHWLKRTSPTLVEPKISAPPTPPPTPFAWPNRMPLIQEAVKAAGQANIPKLTLMGRPDKIIEKGNVVLTTLQPKPQPKSLPKGVPRLPTEPATPYILYIAAKQWRKVKEALDNPADELIIEGYPAFNPQLKAITVFVLNTTTKLQEQARRTK
jgi:hypothetical protein